MKIYKLLITIILLSFISCKENNNQIDHHSASTLVNKTSIDTLIIKNEPIIVFLFPSEKEIKKIKREKGEDNFFTIADDENDYRANINEILADENYKTKITESRFIKFNDNKIFDKSKIDNKWSVIIYANGKTLIVSSVDLFMALSKLKENNSKIDYNSILKSINDNLLKSENSKEVLNQDENLNGIWRIDCKNALTTFEITNSNAYISLYSNSIYINAKIESNPDEVNSFIIKFLNQEDNNGFDKNKLDAENISKEKAIGKLRFKNNKMILNWYGLYNIKTEETDFIEDFVMIKENSGKNPLTLTKCDE